MTTQTASTKAPSTSSQRKTTAFKRMLFSPGLEFICEAHSGASAKIAEDAGFKGIWASGLTISGQMGVRDNNEASWTQVLDVIEFMSDATTIPIMMDGDTGYGNFNNMQRLVRKLEQRSVAAVCIEDKTFPKTNSFIDGHRQNLADIDEFCGKIKAGKDAQRDGDFCIVARVEAFIAGRGLGEALRRAEAYRRSGADAILIHSALSNPMEVLSFKQEWADRSPVVIVPTKYYSTPTDVFREHGFSIVVWANHLFRASLLAMQKVARKIHEDQTVVTIEDSIASVSDIFTLQGVGALQAAEAAYLPRAKAIPGAVVLAATRGKELGDLTREIPKTMVRIGSAPILSHIVSAFHSAGVLEIAVVRGYKKHAVDIQGIRYVDSDDYENTGELVSLQKGLADQDRNHSGIIICYGDVLFRKYIIDLLQDTEDELAVPVDTEWRASVNRNRAAHYVKCSLPYSRLHYNRRVFVERIAPKFDTGQIHGEWMGFLKIGPRALVAVRDTLGALLKEERNRTASMAVLINALVERGHPVRTVYTSGNWCDIDSLEDVQGASDYYA